MPSDDRDRADDNQTGKEQGHSTWIQTESIKKSGETETFETKEQRR
jgi:hypothetical protein